MKNLKEEINTRVTELYDLYTRDNKYRQYKYYYTLIVLHLFFALMLAYIYGFIFGLKANPLTVILYLFSLFCIYKVISVILRSYYHDQYINMLEYEKKVAFVFLTFIVLKSDYGYFSVNELKDIIDDDMQKLCHISYTDKNNNTHKINLLTFKDSELLNDMCQIQNIDVEQDMHKRRSIKFDITNITIHLSFTSQNQTS